MLNLFLRIETWIVLLHNPKKISNIWCVSVLAGRDMFVLFRFMFSYGGWVWSTGLVILQRTVKCHSEVTCCSRSAAFHSDVVPVVGILFSVPLHFVSVKNKYFFLCNIVFSQSVCFKCNLIVYLNLFSHYTFSLPAQHSYSLPPFRLGQALIRLPWRWRTLFLLLWHWATVWAHVYDRRRDWLLR